jgi:CheY-like chemotaxis protein
MTTNRKVLIADDDPQIVRSLAAQCKKLGLEVATASNGLQAILKAKKDPPRLIILDVNMPEADGFRVCELLFDVKRTDIDVVMLTARTDLETLDRCDSLGTYHVHKGPETWAALQSILRETLDIDDAALNAFAPEQTDQTGQLLVDHIRNKVLIVEDDADLGFALERRLKKCGAVTLRASNGIEGYRIAVSERPDVVITDYVMPDAGGHYMIWRLKSTEGTKHIPIIVITGQKLAHGRDIPAEAEREGAIGAVRYFEKPLDMDALFKELGRHCTIQFEPFAHAGA